MVAVYVASIIAGRRTIDDVPKKFKAKVLAEYVEMKSEAPKWAAKFREMAFAEMSHADYFLAMAKEHAENVSWMSDKKKEAWARCQSKASEKMAIIKMILDS